MSTGVWALIAVLILTLTGYLIYVRHDNGGITFRGLSAELRQEAREVTCRVRDRLADYCHGEH
jgi:hypothetical protein